MVFFCALALILIVSKKLLTDDVPFLIVWIDLTYHLQILIIIEMFIVYKSFPENFYVIFFTN